MFRTSCLLLLSFVFLGCNIVPAFGQYYPRYGPGRYNPYAAYNYSAGAALSGSADVISAKGNYLNQSEDARILREKAKQEQIKTEKAAFDWKRYEEENTPTFTEKQEKLQKTKIQAALGNPPTSEITSGRALNTLLPYLKNLIIAGVQGHPVPVNQSILMDINVTTSSTGGNPGLLRVDEKTRWPIALRGKEQKEFEKNLTIAIEKVRKDTVTVKDIKKVNENVANMEKKLSDDVRSGYIDATMWVNGRRFIIDLKDSLRVLQDPNAVELLGGGYMAEGKTVPELVMNMSNQGLKFAPSLPGEEASYISLHNSMVTYAMMAHNDSGFKVKMVPTAFQN